MIKKRIIVPIAIVFATCLGYAGFRLKGHSHSGAVEMVNRLKTGQPLVTGTTGLKEAPAQDAHTSTTARIES